MAVEMAWGRSQHMVVMKLDEDGELAPDYVITDHSTPPDLERRYLRCGVGVWKEMLESGRR